MKVAVAALSLLLAVPAGVQAQSPSQPPLPTLLGPRSVLAVPAARPDQTFSYGEAEDQQAELFLPTDKGGAAKGDATKALRPVIVTIHGGCWRNDLPGREQMRAAAAAFLEKGWAVWNIGYRRIGEEGGGYPGTFQDVARAIDLLRDHADANRLDLSHVVFFGHSAGGHLALWAAGRSRLPDGPLKTGDPLKPAGVVAVGGFGDLKTFAADINLQCGDDTVAKLTGADLPERPDPFADTSPAALLPTGVPVILLHGVYDSVAFPYVALTHTIAARKAGDRAEVQIAPQAGHFEVIVPGTAAFSQAVAAIERFTR